MGILQLSVYRSVKNGNQPKLPVDVEDVAMALVVACAAMLTASVALVSETGV